MSINTEIKNWFKKLDGVYLQELERLEWPSEDEAFQSFEWMMRQGVIQDLQRHDGDVFSFKVHDRGDLGALAEALEEDDSSLQEPFKHFLKNQKWFECRNKHLEKRCFNVILPVCDPYVEEGKQEEEDLVETARFGIVTFDSLMKGIEYCRPDSTAKWVAMNSDSEEARNELTKAIKAYVSTINFLGGFDLKVRLYYKPNEECVAKYRKQFEQALLKLANHPLSRPTVIAALCINQEVLHDLPLTVVLEPRIVIEGEHAVLNAAYSVGAHYIRLSVDFLDYWPVLYHELNHLILRICGFDEGDIAPFKFWRDLLGTDQESYTKFRNECSKFQGLISEDSMVRLPKGFGKRLLHHSYRNDIYAIEEIYDALVIKAHFSNLREMLNMIGVGFHYLKNEPYDPEEPKVPCLVINRLSDFNLLERIPWGHDNLTELNDLLADLTRRLTDEQMPDQYRTLLENAQHVVESFIKVKDWSKEQPNKEAFERLCKLHGRDTSTAYLDTRSTRDLTLCSESNVRKVSGWDPNRIG
ncbi:MAG: hypothetical protein MJ218_02470 [Opitutales bacterium]|nr:hypothetical protein [Opitutales bacterium]